jgi:hypothetical protein
MAPEGRRMAIIADELGEVNREKPTITPSFHHGVDHRVQSSFN